MFTILTICFAITAILMVVFARHSLPQTWIAFVILSAILSFCGNWAPHIASPWPMIAGVIWFITLLIVFEAREIKSNRAIVAMLIMTIAIMSIAFFAPRINGFSLQDKSQPTAQAAASPTYTTWKMMPSDYNNNRWSADGIAEIKNAKTDAEAASAANAWLEKIKTDPNLLVGAAKYLLARDVNKTTLVNKDGWATDEAVQLVMEFELTLGQAKVVAADAPNTGYNSGVENDTVVGSTVAGINGDRKAIQVTLPNGKVIWVMGRCGNIVTKGSPPVPPGKTDQPPIITKVPIPPVTVIVPPPYHPPVLTPKSSNPNDYQHPGTDNTMDSGTGTKPKVPVVQTAPESTPPPVTTTVIKGNIIDTPANKPGAETAITAPSATPAPAPTTSTPVAKPAPETGVNPGTSTGSNTNTTTIVNPFQ